MKQILVTVFVLCLVGCNQNDKFSSAEDLSTVVKNHHTVSNLVIAPSGDSTRNTLHSSAISNVDYEIENLLKSQREEDINYNYQKLARLSDEFTNIHDDIFKVWDKNFMPLYNAYLYENLAVEYAADEITGLNESFADMQTKVENIKVPEFLSEAEQLRIREIKDDLLLAISNRSLAIIEFKSMIGDDEMSHQAFMDIHIDNSNRYLKEVQKDNDALILQNERLLTSK